VRILTLCYEYPPIGGGGGRVAQTVSEELARRGHEVRVQTAALGLRSVDEKIGAVEVHRTASGRRAPDNCEVHEMGLFLATSFLPTLDQCYAWKPDVIHAHFAVPTGLLAWAVHRLTGVPYVLTAHLGDVPGGVPEQTDRLFRIVGPAARQIWREAAGATAVSGFVQGLAQTAYARPVERILNGIDLTGRPAVDSLQIGSPPHLLFLGRFNPQKNAPLLIDALAQLASREWRLTMIGDGPDMPAVKAKIAQHRLHDRVSLLGWRNADEVHALVATADLLCLPSSSEGMPVAAIESLKYGLAIVASDIPGVRDVVQAGENGLTAPAGDAAAFAGALGQALADPERLLALRRASWQKAASFSLPEIISAYERVLRSTGPAR
jgi:glycosyltransferase involved in cell wall biosynthesis